MAGDVANTAPEAGPVAPLIPVLQPTGTPVGQALQLPKRSKISPQLRGAVATIDQTHGDGQLPDLPVKSGNIAGAYGYYARTRQGVPIEIKVNPKGEHIEMTLVHEVGHFLDHKMIRIDDEILQAALARRPLPDELKGWIDAIDESEAVKTLVEYRNWDRKVTIDFGNGPVEVYADLGYMKYLLGRDELWARSYAQYVAVRSGDVTMLEQLDKMREEIYPIQWEDADFEPIAAAIDALFVKKGWLQ